MKGTQLNSEEKQLIVEALLYTAGVDVCGEWNPKQFETMFAIAQKINDPDIKLNNIYLFGGLVDPTITAEIVEKFPNLPKDIIKD